jgi:hypothetical protein
MFGSATDVWACVTMQAILKYGVFCYVVLRNLSAARRKGESSEVMRLIISGTPLLLPYNGGTRQESRDPNHRSHHITVDTAHL